MSVWTVTDLPEPDSPTMPRISPFSTVNDILSTAFTTPLRVWKYVFRLLISSSGISILGRFRVERVAQSIADEVQAEQRGREKQRRENE